MEMGMGMGSERQVKGEMLEWDGGFEGVEGAAGGRKRSVGEMGGEMEMGSEMGSGGKRVKGGDEDARMLCGNGDVKVEGIVKVEKVEGVEVRVKVEEGSRSDYVDEEFLSLTRHASHDQDVKKFDGNRSSSVDTGQGKQVEVEVKREESDYGGDSEDEEFLSLAQEVIHLAGDEVDVKKDDGEEVLMGVWEGVLEEEVGVEKESDYGGDSADEALLSLMEERDIALTQRVDLQLNPQLTPRQTSPQSIATRGVGIADKPTLVTNTPTTQSHSLTDGQKQPTTPVSAQPASRNLEPTMQEVLQPPQQLQSYTPKVPPPQLSTPSTESFRYKPEYAYSATQYSPDSNSLQTPVPKRREHPRSVIPVLHLQDRIARRETSPRRPLGDISNNAASTASNGSATVPNVTETTRGDAVQEKDDHILLPAYHFLTFYKLEMMYLPEDRIYAHDERNRKARRAWLAKLGIDCEPYWRRLTAPPQRKKLEDRWAIEHPDKRQTIERTAIKLKFGVDLEVPIRIAPAYLVGEAPLTFAQLEEKYFHTPARTAARAPNIWPGRTQWLKDLNLLDSVYYSIEHTQSDIARAETLYQDKPILERRAIQAKAEYLNALLIPIERSWISFEETYQIYPRQDFKTHTDWQKERANWLEMLGLKYKPYLYLRVNTVDTDLEACDVAWAKLNATVRAAKEAEASAIKSPKVPVLESWLQFEMVHGLVSAKDKYDVVGYQTARLRWLKAIGLDFEPFISGEAQDLDGRMQVVWAKKEVEERVVILRRAEGRGRRR